RFPVREDDATDVIATEADWGNARYHGERLKGRRRDGEQLWVHVIGTRRRNLHAIDQHVYVIVAQASQLYNASEWSIANHCGAGSRAKQPSGTGRPRL